MDKIPTHLLNLAGEYRVCSELIKRGVFATVTYGNHKGVDVYAISDRRERALRIEVKTSQSERFVTSITQKGLEKDDAAPDFWVLFQLRQTGPEAYIEQFFILSHDEICQLQRKRNDEYGARYEGKHGKQPDFSKGVDNVTVSDIEPYRNAWKSIVDRYSAGLRPSND